MQLPPFVERLLQANMVAKVGILVLFFGLAFLVKYAYERVHVPIELRLSAVALGAIALLFVGWRLRVKRAGYALALQGGGIAVLYLVIFAAFRMYGVLPATLAFGLLFGIAVASAVLAVAQNSLSLAVIGVSGGFLAPILASTGQGSHVMLFSYYAVLNTGIVVVAWLKAWRVLNVLGFAFTFAFTVTSDASLPNSPRCSVTFDDIDPSPRRRTGGASHRQAGALRDEARNIDAPAFQR
jgi:uncharacterized membrane protein